MKIIIFTVMAALAFLCHSNELNKKNSMARVNGATGYSRELTIAMMVEIAGDPKANFEEKQEHIDRLLFCFYLSLDPWSDWAVMRSHFEIAAKTVRKIEVNYTKPDPLDLFVDKKRVLFKLSDMINIDSDKIEYESYARTVKDYRESLKQLYSR